MKNLIFIGMPASGKSTIGIVAAKRLGYRFIDTDLMIQEQEGKLLREIIQERGTAGFLEVEDQVNASVQAERTVIAPGGCTVRTPCGIIRRLGSLFIFTYRTQRLRPEFRMQGAAAWCSETGKRFGIFMTSGAGCLSSTRISVSMKTVCPWEKRWKKYLPFSVISGEKAENEPSGLSDGLV